MCFGYVDRRQIYDLSGQNFGHTSGFAGPRPILQCHPQLILVQKKMRSRFAQISKLHRDVYGEEI